uniref:Uncharacterized protein n=1 Tax=Octopus bimaculoides TaxID=37653 RepID=A0A0L8G7I6_OCTBM
MADASDGSISSIALVNVDLHLSFEESSFDDPNGDDVHQVAPNRFGPEATDLEESDSSLQASDHNDEDDSRLRD